MPQFDQASFLNQVCWFFIVFLSFYFFIISFFLPKICSNIKFRKKKLNINLNFSKKIIIEKNYKFLTNSFKFEKIYNTFFRYINEINKINKVKNEENLKNIFNKNKISLEFFILKNIFF